MGISWKRCGDNKLKKGFLLAIGIIGILMVIYGLAESYIFPEQKNETQKKVQIKVPNTEPNLMFVSATEYSQYDSIGGTIVKLLDFKNDKINTTCWEKILYPDKSTYMDWTQMNQQWEYGNYYINFSIPSIQGIYDQEVRCIVGNKNISLGKGFHVGESNATDIILSTAYGETYG